MSQFHLSQLSRNAVEEAGEMEQCYAETWQYQIGTKRPYVAVVQKRFYVLGVGGKQMPP